VRDHSVEILDAPVEEYIPGLREIVEATTG
jgi:hypothetical protein